MERKGGSRFGNLTDVALLLSLLSLSLSPCLPISLFPYLPISLFPYLPISLSISIIYRQHHAVASLSPSQLKQAEQLRGELDDEVGRAASRIVGEATMRQNRGEGALGEIQGGDDSSLHGGDDGDKDGMSIASSSAQSARSSRSRKLDNERYGGNRHGVSQSTLKVKAGPVRRIGWILKRGDGVFSSYHERYFCVYGNKSIVYFDGLAAVDDFIDTINKSGEVLPPLSPKLANRTVDLASIISAKDGDSGRKALVVSSLSKHFTLAAV